MDSDGGTRANSVGKEAKAAAAVLTLRPTQQEAEPREQICHAAAATPSTVSSSSQQHPRRFIDRLPPPAQS